MSDQLEPKFQEDGANSKLTVKRENSMNFQGEDITIPSSLSNYAKENEGSKMKTLNKRKPTAADISGWGADDGVDEI
jgi:hypothetical protein